MTTFTSSLPDELLEKLSELAKELKIPKNRIIEKALTHYLEQIKKAKYAKSYIRISKSEDMLLIAEEGIEDYFKVLKELEK